MAGGDESADAATRSAFVEVAGERLPFGLCVREVCAGYSTAVAALASALLVFADK